jgi:undecaprenyl-diphosphatase
MNILTARVAILYILLSITAFTFLSFQYDSALFSTLDQAIATSVTTLFPSESLPFFIFITDLGSFQVTLPILFIVGMYLLFRREFLLFVLAMLNFHGVRSLNRLLKGYFERERPPELDRLAEATYFSYPSGHSMNSMAFYGLLCWLFLQVPFLKRKWKVLTVYLFSLLILTIGLSRIYLRVHFPTDVLGGFLAGSYWLVILIFVYRLFQGWLGKEKQKGASS